MADLTPNDIVNKDFRLTLRGYAADEVDDFLQEVSDSLFHTLEEQQRLKSQLEETRARVQQYQDTEQLLKNALLLAEKTADEVRQRAHVEAEQIRQDAMEALRAERAELEEMRQQRTRMIIEVRALLNAHLALLDAQEGRLAAPLPEIPAGEER